MVTIRTPHAARARALASFLACITGLVAGCGGSDGPVDPLTVPEGRAYAGVLTDEQLPEDSSTLATWEGGDIALVNENIGVLIEGSLDSDLYNPWGGQLVGVWTMEGGEIVNPADFNEIIMGLGRFTVRPTSISVDRSGRSGGVARVRVEGVMRPIPFVDTLASVILRANFSALTVKMDYELEPGAEHVDVFLEVENPGDPFMSTKPSIAHVADEPHAHLRARLGLQLDRRSGLLRLHR